MNNNINYYRPEWTCGRYNHDSHTAIMYNLIEGQSYFFESQSAQVIGDVLAVGRNNSFNTSSLAEHTGIHIDSINEFMQTLVDVGLVTSSLFGREKIKKIQLEQGKYIKHQFQTVERTIQEKLPYKVTSAEQSFAESADKSKYPISSVMFELTYNCSEKCLHCYNSGATRNDCETSLRSRDEMNLDDYKRVIDELYDLGLYKVCLSGGDPFSKPIAWDIIDYLYQKDIAFDIYTNGQSITKDIDRLIYYYPRVVGISIYSPDETVHDKITRIKGSLTKSLQVAEQLSNYGVPLEFKCVVMRPNVKSYFKVADLAKQYGAVIQLETNLSNGVDGDVSVISNLRLPKEALEIVLRDENTAMYVGKEAPNYGGQSKDTKVIPCGAGLDTYNITPEGNITPCCAFPLNLGSIRKQSVISVLSNNSALKTWQATTIGDIDKCGKEAKCAYCNLCVGNGYIEHGTPLKAATSNCFMAELRYELAQKLQNGNDPLNGLTVAEKLQQMDIKDVSEFHREIATNYRNIDRTLE